MPACVWAQSVQLCWTPCNSMNCSPPGSSVHGILQARILEWVVIPFSRGSSRPRDQTRVSCIARVKWILYCLSHWGSPINHINRLKKENHLIVWTDERENAFDKTQYPFTIKTLRNTGELPQLNENHLQTDWFLYVVTLDSMCIGGVQLLSRVWLFESHGLQHMRIPCPSLSPGVCLNSCPFSQWCYQTISSSVVPFSSCLQSFPASGSFPMSQFCASGGQRIGALASASVCAMNI